MGELGKAETALKKAEEVAKKFLQEEGEQDFLTMVMIYLQKHFR